MEKIHSRSGTDEGIDIAHAELFQIQQQVVVDKQLDPSWGHIIRKPSYRKRMLLSIATTGIGQFSGVLVINSEFVPELKSTSIN